MFFLATINGPFGLWNHKYSSKHSDSSHSSHRLRSDDIDVDLLYFEVFTDNEEICGQAAIPLAALRAG